MKLPDFLNDKDLNKLRQRMGIARDKFGDIASPFDKTAPRELVEGIAITQGSIKPLPDGTLSNGKYRIFIYIQDHSEFAREIEPRFHFANCKTIEQMTQINRFERYVQAVADKDEFRLRVNSKNGYREFWKKLRVCQNCLEAVCFNGFRLDMPSHQREQMVDSFTATQYFEIYPMKLFSELPSHSWETSPRDTYTSDFPVIARQLKVARRWRCEECHQSFEKERFRRFLSAHHEGLKHENDKIRILCIECHAKQPLHAHMKSLPEYKQYQEMKRREAGF